MVKKKIDNDFLTLTKFDNLPKHIAIIMDGNGRWSKQFNLPKSEGHKKGAEVAREIIKYCIECGIEYLTLYTFSSENWKRSEDEVQSLMDLFRYYLQDDQILELAANDIKIRVIGDITKFDDDIQKKINKACKLTKKNKKLNLNIALNYGSQEEIVYAVKKIANKLINKELETDNIDYKLIKGNLYTADIPDPDFLIRTSGEQRVSNFLLLQLAYTEFYFSDVLWPDFSKNDFYNAVLDYSKRQRRYGG